MITDTFIPKKVQGDLSQEKLEEFYKQGWRLTGVTEVPMPILSRNSEVVTKLYTTYYFEKKVHE